MKNKYDNIDWKKYKKEKLNCFEISKIVGCSFSTAKRYLKKIGFKTNHIKSINTGAKKLKNFWGKKRETTSLKYINQPITPIIRKDLKFPPLFKTKINEAK
jgi:hypothetical protein